MDTICVTLEDYFQDYNHLREKNFDYVINEGQNLVYKRYITAMLSKKMTFKTVDEAQHAATKILKEANQIRSFFRRIAPEGVNVDWPFEVINMLAEVSFLFLLYNFKIMYLHWDKNKATKTIFTTFTDIL